MQVELGASHLICTPGNHDVLTRDGMPDDYWSILAPYQGSLPVPDQAASTLFWKQNFVSIDVRDATILALNTVGKARDRQQARRGVFDEQFRDDLIAYLASRDLQPLRVAVLHHHPMLHSAPGVTDNDVLERGDELLDVLERFGFALIIHGHKHQARLTYGPSGQDSPAVLASGSLSWIPKGALITLTRNLFHIVEVSNTMIAGCSCAGEVNTWQFIHGAGWVPSSMNSTQFPHRSGFGCRLPTSQLAQSIATHVSAPMKWSEVVTQVPALRFLTPGNLQRVATQLDERHDIDVMYDQQGDIYMLAPIVRV